MGLKLALGAFTDVAVDRNLQSLIHLPDFDGVRAILIGRFQKKSEMNEDKLRKIISSKKELSRIPIAYGLDFGHTDPYITLPVGGTARVEVDGLWVKVQILEHCPGSRMGNGRWNRRWKRMTADRSH